MGKLSEKTRTRLARLSTAARTSAEAAQDDREKRDFAIAEADDEGGSIKEIARITLMSPSHVQRILVAVTAERQADAAAQIEELVE